MTRVITALVLIPVFCYLVIGAPPWAFLTAITAVAVLLFREYGALVSLHEIARPGLFGYAAGILLLFLPRNDLAFLVLAAILATALVLRSRALTEALPVPAALLLGGVDIFGS